MRDKKSFIAKPWFLVLLPVFFVLHGYTEFYPVISFEQCVQLLLKTLLWTGIVFGLLYLFYQKDHEKASLSCFLVLLVFVFFGPFHDFIKHWFGTSLITRYGFLLPMLFLAFIVWLVVSRKKTLRSSRLFSYLSVLFLLLMAIDCFTLLGRYRSYTASIHEIRSMTPLCSSCDKPDVYLIVADGYAGDQALREVFHYNNAKFQQQLRNRGFHIVNGSTSNYNFTPFTMASLLHMDYLKGLNGSNTDLNDRQICYNLINNNYSTSAFETMGYECKNFSIFRFAEHSPLATSKHYRSGTDLLMEQTFIGRLDRDIRFNTVTRFKIKSEMDKFLYYELESNKVLYEHFRSEIKTPSGTPRFCYTHLEMPHYPYYFDSTGRPYPNLSVNKPEEGSDRNKYLNYLVYSNSKYLELIDEILLNSKRPPVILFISDHGFREYNDSTPLRYHYMNMNAVLTPGRNYSAFYEGMSTVNLFRSLFNSEFGQKLPYLKDSTIFIRE